MRRAKEEYKGHYCAKCGKKAGECEHQSAFFLLGKCGEYVVAE